MGQSYSYLYQNQWIAEGSTYRFPLMTLYDETGAVVLNPTTVELSLIDLSTPAHPLIGAANQDIKTPGGRGRVTSGVLALTIGPPIGPTDTTLISTTNAYELRQALVTYTFGSGGTKSASFPITFVVQRVEQGTPP